VVVWGLAWWAFRTRSAERLGDTLIFPPMQKALVPAITLAFTFFVGYLMMRFFGMRGLRIGYVVGMFAGFCLGTMLAEKSFNIGAKIKGLIPMSGALMGVYIAFLLVTQVALQPPMRRIPDASEVVGVSLNQRNNLAYGLGGGGVIEDPLFIQRVVDAHERLIRTHNLHREAPFGHHPIITITYHMADGRMMTRSYREDDRAYALFNTELHVLSRHTVFEAPHTVGHVSLEFTLVETRGISQVRVHIEEVEHVAAFLEALQGDVRDMLAGVRPPNPRPRPYIQNLRVAFTMQDGYESTWYNPPIHHPLLTQRVTQMLRNYRYIG